MDTVLRNLRSLDVPAFERGSEEYERSVATPNLLFRFSRPDCVVQPKNTSQVEAVVQQAKAQKLKLTIKCGGHSYAGHSTAFEGILLDLRNINTVDLDTVNGIVTIDAGCQWGHVYKTLINKRLDGVIINGGRCPFVGVSGFILGGGLGPFTRSFGMGSDTLKEATVVTANGKSVTVSDSDSPDSDKGRLFWALCGAGGANFGVLVQMKMKVQRLRSQEVIVAGRYQWFPKLGITDNFMTTMRNFYTAKWPDQMTIDSTWMCDLRQATGDGVRFLIYYDGDKDSFDRDIEKYIQDPELRRQLQRRSLPEKSTRFLHETLVTQWSEETTRAFPTNRTYSIYSSFVFGRRWSDITRITAVIREEMAAFRSLYAGEKVSFLVTWIHAGGKASTARQPVDTAFFWRDAAYHTYVTLEWEDKWMERDMRGFLGSVKKRLRPFSLRGEAAFINFPDGALSSNSYERAYFGDNRYELRRIKTIWDKDNFFQSPQGIRRPEDVTDDDTEESGGEVVDEELLTDSIAGVQWEHYETRDLIGDLDELGAMM